MEFYAVILVGGGPEDEGVHVKIGVVRRRPSHVRVGKRSADEADVLVQKELVRPRVGVNQRYREGRKPVRGDREILVGSGAVARHVLAQVKKLDRVEDTLFGVDDKRVDLLSRSESTRPHRVREVVFGVTLNGLDKLSVVH